MSKTLKELFEVYRPKAKDEADFVDKHVVIKHKDRNGNGDDIFNGNTKTIKRKEERKGYDAGDDEKVYEEVKDRIIDALARAAEELGEDFDLETLDAIAEEVMLDELSKGTVKSYSGKAMNQYMNMTHGPTAWDKQPMSVVNKAHQRMKGMNIADRKMGHSITKAKVPVTNEEVEDLDELSKGTMGRYINKAATKIGTQGVTAGLKIASDENSKKNFKNMGKREKGIARAVNKLTKEEVEDLDELSKDKLNSYLKGSRKDILDADANDDTKTYNKRVKGFISATKKVKKLNKEEVEDLDELSKKTLGAYIKKASPSAGAALATAVSSSNPDSITSAGKRFSKRTVGIDRAVNKLTKEDIINNAINTYIPEDIELPSNEERLVENLDAQNVSEQHIHILLSMFEGLNEQNQNRMLETSKHIDGVNSLLDFAITNRGE